MAQAETPPGRAGDSLEGQEIPKAEAETAKAASAKVKMAREAKADAAAFGGRGQLPAGVANAISQGMAGGFAQTDLTGEADATGGAQGETVGQAGAGVQAAAELSSGTAVASSSDSFLLQGTTGQGLAARRVR